MKMYWNVKAEGPKGLSTAPRYTVSSILPEPIPVAKLSNGTEPVEAAKDMNGADTGFGSVVRVAPGNRAVADA
jgi:hypothetical protein